MENNFWEESYRFAMQAFGYNLPERSLDPPHPKEIIDETEEKIK